MHKIAIGADIAGFELKEKIKAYLTQKKKYEILDMGMYAANEQIPYYEVAKKVAIKVQSGEAEKGIIFCGTGGGVSIVANKFKGVYATVVESEFGGLHARVINNTNVLAMGGWVFSEYVAKRTIDLWLNSQFTEGYAEIADFLKKAAKEVEKIDHENMK